MKHTISQALLYALIFLLPIQLGKHFFPDYTFISGVRIDYLSPTIYLTDLISLVLIALNIDIVNKSFANKKFLFLLIGIVFHISISMAWQVALYKWVKIISFVSLFYIFRSAQLNYKTAIKLIIVSSLAQLILSVTQFATGHSVQGLWYWLGERYYRSGNPDLAVASIGIKQFIRPYATFSHPNSLAGFYVLMYFFTLLFSPFRKYGILKVILLLVTSMLIFISFSKTAILTYAALNIMYLLKNRKSIDCALCFATRIVTILVIAGIVLSATGDSASAEKRLGLIDNAMSIVVTHPLTGVGLGNYLFAEYAFPNKYSYFFLQPVHNIFLLLFAETGIILGGFLVYQIYKTLKPHIKTDIIFYMILTIMITGLLDHYWLTLQQNMLLMPVVFGLALSTQHHIAPSNTRTPQKQQ